VTEYLRTLFQAPDFKQRFVFTLLMFAIYRLGSHIPIPGIDTTALEDFFRRFEGTIFSLYDIFSGGNIGRMTVFALGVMPYISASIMMQLLTVAIPELQRLAKEEGDYGRYKINQYTRYLTVFVAFVQSLGISLWIQNQVSPAGIPVVPNRGFTFVFITVTTLVAGTMFLVWIGERISEKGIGNGMSLLIFAGIVANFPNTAVQITEMFRQGELTPFDIVGTLITIIAVIMGIVYVHEAERRIPIQYPRRQVGRQEFTGGSTYLPIKVNPAGVIPIIFAQAILIIPSSVLAFIEHPMAQLIHDSFNPTSILYNIMYVIFIVFFTYFYTAVIINPVDVADNLKRAGGFIPGVRPGTETQRFLETLINRLVFVGAVFLCIVAIVPLFISVWLRVPLYFGGTTALIVVGVALDTLRQLEAQMTTMKYKGYTVRRRR